MSALHKWSSARTAHRSLTAVLFAAIRWRLASSSFSASISCWQSRTRCCSLSARMEMLAGNSDRRGCSASEKGKHSSGRTPVENERRRLQCGALWQNTPLGRNRLLALIHQRPLVHELHQLLALPLVCMGRFSLPGHPHRRWHRQQSARVRRRVCSGAGRAVTCSASCWADGRVAVSTLCTVLPGA